MRIIMVLIHIKADLLGFRFDAATLIGAGERRRSRLRREVDA
jgi:hypothetical protein